MRRKNLTVLSTIGAIALAVTLAPAAGAVTATVDPAAKAALTRAVYADLLTWHTQGGTIREVCSSGSSGSLGYVVRYGGPRQPAWARVLTGKVLPASETDVVLTPTRTVAPLIPTVRNALRKHGLITTRSWFSKPGGRDYVGVGDLSQDREIGELLSTKYTTLTGTAKSFRGTVVESSTDFTSTTSIVAITDGVHLRTLARKTTTTSLKGGTSVEFCKTTLTFDHPTLRVPAALTRHINVVEQESKMALLSGEVAYFAKYVALSKSGGASSATSAADIQIAAHELGSELRKARIIYTRVPGGVSFRSKVTGWAHPLVWKVLVVNHRAVAKPVAS